MPEREAMSHLGHITIPKAEKPSRLFRRKSTRFCPQIEKLGLFGAHT